MTSRYYIRQALTTDITVNIIQAKSFPNNSSGTWRHAWRHVRIRKKNNAFEY